MRVTPFLTLLAIVLLALCAGCSTVKQNEEASLIAALHSGDMGRALPAIHKLAREYPDRPAVIAELRAMLHDPASYHLTNVSIQQEEAHQVRTIQIPVDNQFVAAKATRALGACHITPTESDLDAIFTNVIASQNINDAMDGIKALREMNATNAVPRLLPLLGDRNIHVLRDTIRTLGVVGDHPTKICSYLRLPRRHRGDQAVKSEGKSFPLILPTCLMF
jgi:hypothetical protein